MSTQRSLPIETPKKLIELPADQLLSRFGSGGHSPGSGSAAALMGLLSAQLIITVCKVSTRKADDVQLEFVLEQVHRRIQPTLEVLLQRDAEDFDEVIKQRQKRDSEVDPVLKRRFRESALRGLERSTDLIFEVVNLCISLIGYANIVFDLGAKRVRGDSGAAISVAIAGAMSGLFIINLNLRSFNASRWARSAQIKCDRMQEIILLKQTEAFTKVSILRPKTSEEPTLF